MGRWWAQAPLAQLFVEWCDDEDDVARPIHRLAVSTAIMLGRPGLCERLRAFRLSPVSPELSWSAYSALIMLLARVAPALFFLSLESMCCRDDAPAFTACVRALGHLRQLRHLYIEPPVHDVTCLSLLPHLRTLHLGISPLLGTFTFLPPRPMPALLHLICHDPCCVSWQHLPNLSHLDIGWKDDNAPVLLAPFASSLTTLVLWSTPPSCVVPAPLPHLQALLCTPAMFMRLPSLPALAALDIVVYNASPPLPLPDAVVGKAASLPALATLGLSMPHEFAPVLAHLDFATSLQRRLPRCSVFFEATIKRVSLEELDDSSTLEAWM